MQELPEKAKIVRTPANLRKQNDSQNESHIAFGGCSRTSSRHTLCDLADYRKATNDGVLTKQISTPSSYLRPETAQ